MLQARVGQVGLLITGRVWTSLDFLRCSCSCVRSTSYLFIGRISLCLSHVLVGREGQTPNVEGDRVPCLLG